MTSPLNSCLFPKCPFTTDSGLQQGAYAIRSHVLISQPNSKSMTSVGNDLVSSRDLRGKVVKVFGGCPLQSVFVLGANGPHSLDLSKLDRVLSSSQTFNALFRPNICAEAARAEHIILLNHLIVEADRDGEFLLQPINGMGPAFYRFGDESPERASSCIVSGGGLLVRKDRSIIEGSETEVARAISAISTIVPGVRAAMEELTSDRSSSALLSITTGKGETAEVAFELQSRKGGVWLEIFRLSAEDRAELFTIVEILNGVESLEIPH